MDAGVKRRHRLTSMPPKRQQFIAGWAGGGGLAVRGIPGPAAVPFYRGPEQDRLRTRPWSPTVCAEPLSVAGVGTDVFQRAPAAGPLAGRAFSDWGRVSLRCFQDQLAPPVGAVCPH